MKNIFKVALATLAIAGMSGAAKADLNYNGEVGLPINPTAQVPQQGGFRLQGNYYDLGGSDKLYSLGGAIRASATSPIEINGAVNYVDSNGGGSDTRFSLGAKYLFSRESDPVGVRIAAGVGYSELSNLKNTRGYVVASKSLSNPVEGRVSATGHLGLRYDHYNAGVGGKVSVFVGAEVPVTRTGEFQVLGEIGTKTFDGGNTPYSVGVRYRPMQQPFGATIGLQRLDVANNNARLFVQVGYTFGK